MIVEMNKYSFLIYHADYPDFLEQIREIGVVHVIEKQNGTPDKKTQAMLLELSQLTTLIKTLSGRLNEAQPKVAARLYNFASTQEEFKTLSSQRDALMIKIQTLTKEIQLLEAWGDFDPASLDRLRSVAYRISFFVVPASEFKPEWEGEYNAIEINRVGTMLHFITITPDRQPLELDAEAVVLPPNSLTALSFDRTQLEKEVGKIDEKITDLAKNALNDLQEELGELKNQIEWSKVEFSTVKHADEKIMLLEGWIPAEHEKELEAYLGQKEIFFQVEKPQEEETPPVLLKNGSFAKLFEPITKIFSLPNYREMDLTPFLAPFFMLFFGFCAGDAGYGVLILLFATLAKLKMSESVKPILSLAQWLGLAAIIFGSLSGTFFGIELAKVEAFVAFKEYFLDMNKLMILSIALGAVQVFFGMILNVVNISRQKGFKYAISKVGWMLILLSGASVLGLPKMGVNLSEVAQYTLYALMGLGGASAFFYNSPGKNVFLNIGSGLWDSYNMATGIVGDLLSYIRLFALGLTGGILGGVFNKLAIDLSPDIPVFGILVTILILLIGHSITIVLTILGACIHPMRLTFVEFYKNAGFEGGGKEYKPFQK